MVKTKQQKNGEVKKQPFNWIIQIDTKPRVRRMPFSLHQRWLLACQELNYPTTSTMKKFHLILISLHFPFNLLNEIKRFVLNLRNEERKGGERERQRLLLQMHFVQ